MAGFMDVKMSSIASSVIYCILSSSMSLLNKYTLTVFPFATTLVFFQYAFSFLAVGLGAAIGILDMSSIDLQQIKKLIPVALFFHLCIWTGSKVMLHGNVDTYIAFRSIVPGVIAVFDSYRTGIFPGSAEIFSLLLVAIAGSSFALVDDKFNQYAYAWGLTFICTVTVESIMIKHTFDTTNVSPWQMSFYLNLFGSIFALLFILSSSDGVEHSEINVTYFTTSHRSGFVVLSSCITGFLTSLANSFARKALGAASFSMLGVANKFITIALNVFIWKNHSSLLATIQLIIAVSGTASYSHATSMSKNTTMNKWFNVSISTMLLISVVVLFISRLPSESSTKLSAVEEHINISSKTQESSESILYSKIKCVGNKVSDRSCILTDAYFESKSNLILINVDTISGFTLSETLSALGIPPSCGNGCGYFIPASSPARLHRRDKLWRIVINKSKTPPQSACHRNSVVVMWKQLRHNNFGHLIIDNLLPLYMMQLNLGEYDFKRELILVNDCHDEHQWTNSSVRNCMRMQNMYESLFYKVTYLRDLQSSCPNILFSRLYIGGGGYGTSYYGTLHELQVTKYLRPDSSHAFVDSILLGNKGISHYMELLKHTIAYNYGLDYSLQKKAFTKIVIADKRTSNNLDSSHGTRSINGTNFLVEKLQKIFPSASIIKSDFRMGLKEQFVLLMDTNILIVPFGGIGFSASFLPHHATTIIISLPYGGVPLSHHSDDFEGDYYWKYLSYMNILKYKFEEFEGLVLPSSNKNQKKKAKEVFSYCKRRRNENNICDRFNYALHAANYEIDSNKLAALINFTLQK